MQKYAAHNFVFSFLVIRNEFLAHTIYYVSIGPLKIQKNVQTPEVTSPDNNTKLRRGAGDNISYMMS